MKSADIIESARLSSLEIQLFTYLSDDSLTIKEIHSGFKGLASERTLRNLAEASPYFHLNENNEVNTVGYLADITYTFSCDSPLAELLLGGQTCETGTDKKKKNVLLTVQFELLVQVKVEGAGNWTLDTKAIKINNSTMVRKLETNPLVESGEFAPQLRDTEKIN